ncbi:MAG: ISAs1 family transposase [Bacteroidales bacterium]
MFSLPNIEVPDSWLSLNTIVRIDSERIIKGEKQQAVRYYLSSEDITNPSYYIMLVRGHWGVENQLHWHLDVTFKEDASRARKDNAPLNLNILRKIALQRVNLKKDKLSKKKRRFRASMNLSYLQELLEI